jgi:RimJ/RimL family protein N-acetyltransferase
LAIVERKMDLVFVGRRVRLRPVTEDDLPYLIKWDNDPEITRWAGKKFENDEDAREWYLSRRSLQRRTYAIEAENRELIGEIEVINISWRLHTAEIRIFIGEKHLWDKGLGEESVRTLTQGLFESTTLSEVFLRVDDRNVRAKRCYSKAGFRPRGRVRLDPGPDKPSTLLLMTLSKIGAAASA